MRLGLLLGGGGIVGIAWETAVLAGLADACGFDPASSTVIVGTSAGSAVGANMALGKDPRELAESLRHDTSTRTGSAAPLDMENGPFAEILKLMMSPEGWTPAGAAKIGKMAVEAETSITEEQLVDNFRQSLGADDWPTVDFRPTSTSCSTGEPKFWSAADGIELPRAVASSCAIPGYYPSISFKGEYYMDGTRGKNPHAVIVRDLGLDAALFIGPALPIPGMDATVAEDMAAIEAMGVKTHTILGSEKLNAAGLNLMDPLSRGIAVDIGLADGAAHAGAVATLLS